MNSLFVHQHDAELGRLGTKEMPPNFFAIVSPGPFDLQAAPIKTNRWRFSLLAASRPL